MSFMIARCCYGTTLFFTSSFYLEVATLLSPLISSQNFVYYCSGVDNPGHPFIMTVGLVAGDEESYSTFSELFDSVISGRHGG